MNENNVKKTYDEVPYTSNPFAICSIFRLESIAKMSGFEPASFDNCKVLELGCSFGGNLMMQALRCPNSHFVGIDLSSEQIAGGKEIIKQMGIKNLELRQGDICELAQMGGGASKELAKGASKELAKGASKELAKDTSKELGKFDYIIIHGIYSWVPDFVKDAIFEVAKNYLAPHGLIYISYNTYPGWKGKDVLRDLMLFAASNETALSIAAAKDIAKAEIDANGELSAKNKLAMAKGFCQAMVDFSTKIGESESYKLGISRHTIDFAKKVLSGEHSQYYVMHEYFETFNDPCYFRDFVAKARNHGLDYVADTHLQTHFSQIFSSIPAGMMPNDRIIKEQFADFLLNKAFRCSILGLKDSVKSLGAGLDGGIKKSVLESLHLQAGFEYKNGANNEIEIISKLNNAHKIKPELKWLCDEFNACYPGTLLLRDLVSKHSDKSDIIWASVAQLLTLGVIDFSAAPLNKLAYEGGKTRLKEHLKGYVNYFASNENHVIGCANELNALISLSSLEAKVALLCDGRDLGKVLKGFKEIIKNSNQSLVQMKNGKQEKIENPNDAVFKGMLDAILEKLSNAGFFENI